MPDAVVVGAGPNGLVAANLLADGRAAVVYGKDLDRTCAGLETLAPGDGEAFVRIGPALVEALMRPCPPVRGALKLGAALATRGGSGRCPCAASSRRSSRARDRRCCSPPTRCTPTTRRSPRAAAVYGLVLVGMAQQVGFPVAEGGSGALTAALVRRLAAPGVGSSAASRSSGWSCAAGGRWACARPTGASTPPGARCSLTVGAPQLYERLVGVEHLPERVREGLRRFQYDHGTVKVEWALDGPVPWSAAEMARTGTRARGGVGRRADAGDGPDRVAPGARAAVPGRGPVRAHGPHAPARGRETFWGYTHVPREVAGRRR